MDEPVRVPGGPVGIHPVGDSVNLMMGLAGLVQEFGNLRLVSLMATRPFHRYNALPIRRVLSRTRRA